MDRLTKFYKHKSEVLSEQFKIFEQQYKQLLESEAPATVFRGTGAGQHAFSDLELEDQMRKFKKSGIFQQVKDENQTQEYKDAKAELDRRRAAKQTSDTTSTAKASPETVAPPPAPAPTPAPKNSAAKTQAPAPEVSGGEESFLYSTSPKPNTTKPTSAPATKSSPAPQNVQSDEDWKNQERHKGVQDMVRQAFDAVGIGAPGINIDGPPNPRQSSSTATPAAAETNRKVETKTVSVSDEERKKTEKEMSDMTLPDSGVAAGSPNQDIATRGKDVQQFANRLLNPLANIPMAKGARSAKPKMGSTGVPGALPVPEQERGQFNLSQEDWETLYGKDTPYPLGEKQAPEPAPAPEPEPEPAPAPEPAPRVKSKGIKVGKTVNDAVANLINAAAPKVSDFMKKNLAKTTPNAMREKLYGTTDVPGAVPAPEQERGQFFLDPEDWTKLHGYEAGNPFITANAFGGEPTVSLKPDDLPRAKPQADATKAAKDYMDRVLLRNYRRERNTSVKPEAQQSSQQQVQVKPEGKTLSAEYLKNLKSAVTRKGGMRIVNTSRPVSEPDYELRAEDEFGLMGSKGDESPQFGMEIDADGNPRLMSPSEVAKERARNNKK